MRTADERLTADDAVVAAGIWGSEVAALAGQSLCLVPVAHPYVYGEAHAPRTPRSPFVRWPDQHVYARDHGNRLGLGTYDHVPLPVDLDALGGRAEQTWPAERFDPAVGRALALLPAEHRFDPAERLNGVFAMTPDNLPLLGASDEVEGLWFAEALWVTQATGAARALAETMLGKPTMQGLDALRPDRFAGQRADRLTASALRLYRDIYATT